DLVQEVLENAIAPFKPFVILPNSPAWMPQVDLDREVLSLQWWVVFANQKITLAQNAFIKVVEQGEHWLIIDHSRFYTVIKRQRHCHRVPRADHVRVADHHRRAESAPGDNHQPQRIHWGDDDRQCDGYVTRQGAGQRSA